MTDTLISANGRFRLTMQPDGNIVAYDHGVPYWATNTFPPAPPVPPVPPASTLPRLLIDGAFFCLDRGAGERWTAIECSDFNLLNRWQHGEDITPILAQRRDVGFNLLRVWTLYDLAASNIGTFLDIDYARVPAFLELCASYGLYVEFTAYTSLERKAHWGKLTDACWHSSNCMCELVNEGDLPVNQIDMAHYECPDGVLCSRGSASSEVDAPWAPWDYITQHTNGADQEQRKAGKQAFDHAELAGVPVLTNETSRFWDVGMWAGADLVRVQALAFDSAAGAALLCAGSCFHSAAGKLSVLWDDQTRAAAQAWVAGATSVGLACQAGDYRRRDDLMTDDLLRVYQRGANGCIVAIRK